MELKRRDCVPLSRKRRVFIFFSQGKARQVSNDPSPRRLAVSQQPAASRGSQRAARRSSAERGSSPSTRRVWEAPERKDSRWNPASNWLGFDSDAGCSETLRPGGSASWGHLKAWRCDQQRSARVTSTTSNKWRCPEQFSLWPTSRIALCTPLLGRGDLAWQRRPIGRVLADSY
jgi:hypothetical protein